MFAGKAPLVTAAIATSWRQFGRHVREAHGIDFSVDLALDVARSARQAPGEREELEHNGVIRKEKQ